MKSKHGKLILLFIIACLVISFFVFDLGQYFNLEFFKSKQREFDAFYHDHQVLTIAVYMGIYIAVTALSLPGATAMTLVGGAIFGLLSGVIIISFASTIGATLAFMFSRFLLKDTVQNKFGDKLFAINHGIKTQGAFYLFFLRLVPAFPFFVINLVMGLSPIKTITFYVVSQIGMLPGTFVYVNAGTELGKISSVSGILSPSLIFSFALLGMFPFVAKKIITIIKNKKAMAGYSKPKHFDYNLVVIGGGSAGLVSAYIASAVKSKVLLVEKNKMGGDCLNTGCVPSKAIIRTAKIRSYNKHADRYGLTPHATDVDFKAVIRRVHDVIGEIAPHDSIERYTKLGVECKTGTATITSPYTVEVDGKTVSTRSIIIATGGEPLVPPIPGLDKIDYLTSDNLWEMEILPERLIVLGGGPIGSEMSQAFARLGSKVTQVEMAPQIMGKEDRDVADLIKTRLEDDGVSVLTGHQATEVKTAGGAHLLVCKTPGGDLTEIAFDRIILAVGRKAVTRGLGLEKLGIELNNNGTISTNEIQQTQIPTIYTAGDVSGPYQFTHTAAHQAWYATVNALFGKFKTFKTDYRVIPWATFTDPEVARVGLNETEAKAKGIAFQVSRYELSDLDRAITESSNDGFIKVLTPPGKDKILGVTIVGPHAGDLIAEYVLAMKYNIGLNKILGTIHIYPTFSEANKYVAGEWKRANKPEKILDLVEKYHSWMRG